MSIQMSWFKKIFDKNRESKNNLGPRRENLHNQLDVDIPKPNAIVIRKFYSYLTPVFKISMLEYINNVKNKTRFDWLSGHWFLFQ